MTCLPKKIILIGLRGFDPSYSWRSIWGTKSLLLEGLKWRVGNGAYINVWQDAWVQGEGNHVVQTPKPDSNMNLLVRDLIDVDNACWDVEAVQAAFVEDERQRV